ncbi:hypothetical protein QQ045_011967 [Rhodiola kirilowii]
MSKRGGCSVQCDGSSNQDDKAAGVGATLFWKGMVYRVSVQWEENINSLLEVECKAIKLGLEMAKEQKLDKVTLFSNSVEAIWALK